MNSKRKCIVILLFIVIVSILFILYNRSHFFFGIYNHCTYSVYKLHSKSFKNHSNFVVNLDRSKFFLKFDSDRVTKFGGNVVHPENSLRLQDQMLWFMGMRHPKNSPKYRECPSRRILTVLLSGQLGNVIWEYMSLIAVAELYSDRLNVQAFLPSNMKRILEIVFERIDTPQMVDLPRDCINVRHAQLVKRNATPKLEVGVSYDSPIILQQYSCRYNDVLRYGFEKFRKKLIFQEYYVRRATKVLMNIKEKFGFQNYEVTFVSVHYRGGNYNRDLKDIYPRTFKGPPTFLFYRSAMRYFNKTMQNVIFVIISTDNAWLRNNIPHLQGFYVAVNPSIGDIPMIDDFVTLSLCNHSILNYGTYSATAALFAGGTTIVFNTSVPLDGKGYTLALGIVGVLPNWFTCDEENCFVNDNELIIK